MKTMKSLNGKIVRVSDEKASELYHEGYQYLPKSEWKEDTVETSKPAPKTKNKVKSNNTSKSQKRQMRKTL